MLLFPANRCIGRSPQRPMYPLLTSSATWHGRPARVGARVSDPLEPNVAQTPLPVFSPTQTILSVPTSRKEVQRSGLSGLREHNTQHTKPRGPRQLLSDAELFFPRPLFSLELLFSEQVYELSHELSPFTHDLSISNRTMTHVATFCAPVSPTHSLPRRPPTTSMLVSVHDTCAFVFLSILGYLCLTKNNHSSCWGQKWIFRKWIIRLWIMPLIFTSNSSRHSAINSALWCCRYPLPVTRYPLAFLFLLTSSNRIVSRARRPNVAWPSRPCGAWAQAGLPVLL